MRFVISRDNDCRPIKTIIKPAVLLFFLQKQKFADFDFHVSQSLAGLALIILLGLGAPDPIGHDYLWWHGGTIVLMGLSYVLLIGCTKWWLRRGGRWDGCGPLFNVLVASWLVGDLLDYLLTLADVRWEWLIPLKLYTAAVSWRAIAGVIPQASLRYILAGSVLSLMAMTLPLLLLWGVVSGVAAVDWRSM